MAFSSFQTARSGAFTASGIWLGTDPALAVEPWGVAGPEPGAALIVESETPLAKATYTVPGLGTSPVATLYLVFNKLPTAEQQHVIASIATADGVHTSLLYAGRTDADFGFGLNTYTSASDALRDANKYVLDGQRTVLIAARLYNPGPGSGQRDFALSLNGNPQPLARFGVQQSHAWTNAFTLLGFLPGAPNLDWLGNAYAARLYLADHSASQEQRTAAYYLAKYNIAL
jgi:hypothetical protein